MLNSFSVDASIKGEGDRKAAGNGTFTNPFTQKRKNLPRSWLCWCHCWHPVRLCGLRFQNNRRIGALQLWIWIRHSQEEDKAWRLSTQWRAHCSVWPGVSQFQHNKAAARTHLTAERRADGVMTGRILPLWLSSKKEHYVPFRLFRPHLHHTKSQTV